MSDSGNGRATAQEIIESITSSMRQGIEDLYTRRLAPKHFRVHLHSSDFARLEGIFRELQADANRALDETLDSLNQSRRGSWLGCLKRWFRERSPGRWTGEERGRLPLCHRRGLQVRPLIKPEGAWQITFHRNEDPASRAGEIVIETTLSEPLSPPVPGEEVPSNAVRIVYRTRHSDRTKASGQPPAARSPRKQTWNFPAVGARLTEIVWAQERGGINRYSLDWSLRNGEYGSPT